MPDSFDNMIIIIMWYMVSCGNLSVPEEWLCAQCNHHNWAGFWLTQQYIIDTTVGISTGGGGGKEKIWNVMLMNYDALFQSGLECIIITWFNPLVQCEVISPWPVHGLVHWSGLVRFLVRTMHHEVYVFYYWCSFLKSYRTWIPTGQSLSICFYA
jgi:hypothetical protein